MASSKTPLSDVLPPLILGTATFNVQYHADPTRMPYVDIVRRALEHGIAAFDTSPYYGPSEILLGDALRKVTPPPPREGYFLITKVGRVASSEFDYSPSWVRYSVFRSLERLSTRHLDLVYTHDVEFVSPAEVLGAVRELRRLRDQGFIRYVGISGYPVHVLASLAEMILQETGEPLDAILSYGNYCVQNTQLGQAQYLERFRAAGVECLLNASILNMGLLTTRGADNGPMATWHPAPRELRQACHDLSRISKESGHHLEEVAIRWALDNWARTGAPFGTRAYPLNTAADGSAGPDGLPARIGVTVMGVSAVEELEETFKLWKSVVLANGSDGAAAERSSAVARIVSTEMWPRLGKWKDYAWESGGESFVNTRRTMGVIPNDEVAKRWGLIPKAVDSPKL